ncbi:MAG: SIS domain-containing protein [bacterium]|nr:SIS domain-containing protein [bacterium]
MDNKYLDGFFQRFNELLYLKNDIQNAFSILKTCFELNSTLFVCGNGGSAADSEHIVGELMKGFLLPRKLKDKKLINKLDDKFGNEGKNIAGYLQNGLRTISLTSHPGLSTAYSNDVSSEMVFAQQLYVLSKPNDVLLAITTSGNSKNVLKAVQLASVLGIKIILLTGESGGKCSEIADCSIKVPSSETYKIQEYHLPIYHILCIMLEDYFYGGKNR